MSTITTIRPSATSVINATTVTGAASAHAALSDNSDASLVVANALGNFVRVATANTVSLLGNERVEQVRYKIRNRTATLGKFADYLVNFYDAATGLESSREQVQANDTSIGTDSLGWRSQSPAGGMWTQTQLDDLEVRLGGVTVPDVAYGYPNLYEAYVDIQVDTQPFLTSPAFTNTTSTRPKLTWVWNDDDGDTPARYVAKIFTQAQYTAAGFNPDTSAAYWSSGEVASSATSATPTIDLTQGSTFRGYVKAAREFMGLGYWYSAWVNTSDLITAADVPDAPTLTATLDAPNSRVALALQGRTNMLDANTANIETSAAGWANQSNGTLGTTTTAGEFSRGTRALTQTAVAAATMAARTAVRYPVTVGVSYTAQAMNRTRVTSRTTRVSIVWYTASTGGSPISTSSGTATANSTSFAQRTVTATAPATAAFAEVWLEVTAAAAISEVHLWDAVSLAPGSSTFWGGGGWLPTADFTIEASDDAGTTWDEIRSTIDASTASQQMTTYDYAAPRGSTRQYRARVISTPSTGATIVSAYTGAQSVTVPNPGDWWLKDLTNPAANTSVLVTDQGDQEVTEQAAAFRPLGRRHPVVVSSGVGGYDASVTILARGAAEWAELRAFMEATHPLLLQAPDGEQWHIQVMSRSAKREASPAGNVLRTVTLAYVEVDAPVLTGA